MKIRPVGAEFFHAGGQADRQTERHDQVIIRFSQFCERVLKLYIGISSVPILMNSFIPNMDILHSSETYVTIYQSTRR
jgi:hypothetical protein